MNKQNRDYYVSGIIHAFNVITEGEVAKQMEMVEKIKEFESAMIQKEKQQIAENEPAKKEIAKPKKKKQKKHSKNRWSRDKVEYLFELMESGFHVSGAAKKLNKTEGAIRGKLKRMGIKKLDRGYFFKTELAPANEEPKTIEEALQ